MTDAEEASILPTYASFAERYAAVAPTKPHNALCERPATLALLGETAGLSVLDAGCGPGICSEILARAGASVHGIDLVPEMVVLARRRCAGLPATFAVGELSRLDGLDGTFDRVLCSLALDYVEHLDRAFAAFRRAARPDGALVFSMAHPMSDWTNPAIRGEASYHERSRFGLHWTGFGEPLPYVEAYRRPLAEILNALTSSGWTLERVVEPRPLPDMKAAAPQLYARLERAPAFICIRARRSP